MQIYFLISVYEIGLVRLVSLRQGNQNLKHTLTSGNETRVRLSDFREKTVEFRIKFPKTRIYSLIVTTKSGLLAVLVVDDTFVEDVFLRNFWRTDGRTYIQTDNHRDTHYEPIWAFRKTAWKNLTFSLPDFRHGWARHPVIGWSCPSFSWCPSFSLNGDTEQATAGTEGAAGGQV